jgi:heme exporter protein B
VGAIRGWAWLVANELALEMKQRDFGAMMMGLAVLAALVLGMIEPLNPRQGAAVGAGILWMGLVYAGMLMVSHTFQREASGSVQVGLVLAIGRMPLLLSKLAVGVGYLWASQGASGLVWMALTGLDGHGAWGALIATWGLSSLGMALIAELLAAIQVQLPDRQPALWLVFMAAQVPVGLSDAGAVRAIFSGANPGQWIGALMALAVLFSALWWLLGDVIWEV